MTRIIRTEQKDRLPIIGNIRIGEKDEKGIPHSLDYFKATGDYSDMLYESLENKKPSTLGIVFLSDDDNFSCTERFEIWVQKRLYAYGNGVEFFEADGKGNFILSAETNIEKCKNDIESRAAKINKSSKWHQIVRLRFAILGFKKVYGVWQFTTQAEESSNLEIVSSYDSVKRATGGRISGIPFDLKIEMVTTSKYGSNSKYPVVSLIASQSYENLNRIRELITAGQELRGLIDNTMLLDYKQDNKDKKPPIKIPVNIFIKRLSEISNIEGLDDAYKFLTTNKNFYSDEEFKHLEKEIIIKKEFIKKDQIAKPFNDENIPFDKAISVSDFNINE